MWWTSFFAPQEYDDDLVEICDYFNSKANIF